MASEPEAFLNQLSQKVAEVDLRYDSKADVELCAIHFFNRMAALDFLPGSVVLKSNLETGYPSALAMGVSVETSGGRVYQDLQEVMRKKNVGLTLAFQNEPGSEVSPTLFLKLLSTAMQEKNETSMTRRDLFLEFSDSPVFKEAWSLLHQPQNLASFTLSLGVSGKWLDSPYTGGGGENKNGETLGSLDLFLQNLRQHLQENPTLRLFFIERALDSVKISQGVGPWVPTPISAGFSSTQEVIPAVFLNLAVMVREEELDWNRLRRALQDAVHFLDNAIDFLRYPGEESERVSKANRGISIGVMGWADLLYLLRIPYNSEEAIDLAFKISQFIEQESRAASLNLAKSRGVFPNYMGSFWQKKGSPVRHAQMTSLLWDPLPSQIAQVSIGIEPHPTLVAESGASEAGRSHYRVHPFLAEVAQKRGFATEPLFQKIVREASLQPVHEIPEDVRKVFVQSDDIDWEWHLRAAHAFERHFDQGVAKLCPIPETFDEKLLRQILEKAHDLGLMSLWFKRQGENLIPEKVEEEEITQIAEVVPKKERPARLYVQPKPRPDQLSGTTYKFRTTCGILYVTVNEDDSGPFEVLSQWKGGLSAGGNHLEVATRLVTLALRSGVDPQQVCESLRNISCPAAHKSDWTEFQGQKILSCSEALAEAVRFHLPSSQQGHLTPAAYDALKSHSSDASLTPPPYLPKIASCEECGQPFKKLNGSHKCLSCRESLGGAH